MKTINIKTIRIDGGTQSRVEINNEIVTEYAEAIKAGAEFPPVVVFNDGVDNWLADGFHRFHAHNQAGKASIAIDVRAGTVRDAKLFSFGANGRHGQRPTNADKRKSVAAMLADSEWVKWSQHKIAETCGVSVSFVSKMVHEAASIHGEQIRPATRTVERNGKSYEQNTTNIGKAAVSDSVASAKPVLAAVNTPPPPADEYTELDAAHDQIGELQAELVVARINSADSDEAKQAATLIAELRAEIKMLRAMNKALTTSRDGFQNQVAEMQRQINRQRRELDRVTGLKTA